MDVASLLWLLQTKLLRFSNPASFEDFYEGHCAKPFVERILAMKGEAGEQSRKFFATFSQGDCFVCCWHKHPRESAAMWRAYAGGSGVAIKSSVNRLRKCLPQRVWIEPIRYVDFETVDIFPINVKDSLCLKRLEFEHEQEIRAIAWTPVGIDPLIPATGLGESGIGLALQPQELIDAIYVGPRIADWFTESLITIAEELGYAIPVIKSALGERPQTFFRIDHVRYLTRWEDVDKVSIPEIVFTEPTTVDDLNRLPVGIEQVESPAFEQRPSSDKKQD